MRRTVYVETSVFSYLAGRRRRDLIVDGVAELAAALIKGVPLPRRAAADAAHIAVAAYHRIDFLLTWNLAHIANAGGASADRIGLTSIGIFGPGFVHTG